MRRVLVTGVTGQLGGDFVHSLAGKAELLPADRSVLDLSRPETLAGAIRELKPDLVIHPAAYTAVDRAESERDLAFRINADAVAEIGRGAKALGAPVIHFSTDYVFDGSSERPWRETDPTGPLSVYGASKLAGEQALEASGALHWTFRIAWVYSTHGRNFLRTILGRLDDQPALRVVADQHGAPTWSREVAESVTQLLDDIGGKPHALADRIGETAGVYHLAPEGVTSWHGFASLIAQAWSEKRGRESSVAAIASGEFRTAAARPAYSALDSAKFRATFGRAPLRDWQTSARACLAELLGD